MFRGSVTDANGFVVPDTPIPIQATSSQPAVGGGGLQSATFYIVNATLQHQNNQNLATHLNSYKVSNWDATFFPMSHRPAIQNMYFGDSDYFPIINLGTKVINSLRLNYILKGTTVVLRLTYTPSSSPVAPNQSNYDIPFGVVNILPLFPTVDFRYKVQDYFIEVLDANSNVLATTSTAMMQQNAVDRTRIFFLNYLGMYDGVDFIETTIVHETTNAEFRKPLPYPFVKTDTGIGRTNISANDNYTCNTVSYNEADINWLMEMADSPVAFMQWTGIEGQADSYMPITILQGKKNSRQGVGDRWVYEFSLEFKLSNERVVLR